MKLAYLHPNVFKPDESIIKQYGLPEKFGLIRLSRLAAHHDFGISGIDGELLDWTIDKIEQNGYRVYISSEGKPDEQYTKYQLKINPSHLQQILFRASMLISDSQSMSVEAAMLGIPSIRYSSFAGKISVLEELEHKYGLTDAVPAGNVELYKEKLNALLSGKDKMGAFRQRKADMLSEKIDTAAFLTWFLGTYPQSRKIMRSQPEIQYKFQ